MVIAEVALSVTLVVLGGQLLGAFSRLVATGPGFDADPIVASVILPSTERYRDPAKRAKFYSQILDAARALPGVESAGTVDALPFSGDSAVISALLANRLWPGSSALGRRICLNCTPGTAPVWKKIVGVVSDAKRAALNEPEKGAVYLAAAAMERSAFVVVRTQRPASDIDRAIRRAVAAIDPYQAVFLTAPLASFIADSVADQRFVLILVLLAGSLAWLMSAAGVYGVASYANSRRTAEIGIRMAVGATPGQIHAVIFRQGFRSALLGMALGAVLALASLRLLRSSLPELEHSDATHTGIAIALVTIAAAAACWLPARRAMQIDPISALRHD